MSRDWTPHELWAVEQLQIAEGLGNYFDFLRNSHWVINGEKVPLCTETEITLRQSYPMLGKFLDNFAQLHIALSDLEGGLEFLSQKDQELNDYVEQGRGDPNSPLIRWFEGTLDPGFYYREHNNELLVEALIAEAREQVRTTLADRLDTARDRADQETGTTNTKDRGR